MPSVDSVQKIIPVLHVGFHKAASTTLQHGLFGRHSDIAVLGEPRQDPSAMEALRGAMWSCHRHPAERKEFDIERGRRLWREAMDRVPPGKVPLFSKESLTRCWFYRDPGDPSLPMKLHSVIGPARIVIMARHQIRLLESLYITRTKGPGYQSAEDWFETNKGGPTHFCRYHAVAQSFADAFGRENVAIFLLEDLQDNAAAFAERLCDFIGIDPAQGVTLIRHERRNVRTSHRHHVYSRLRKQWGPSGSFSKFLPEPIRGALLNFIASGRGAEVKLPAHCIAEIESYCRDDNRQLVEKWGLPLAKYKYPL